MDDETTRLKNIFSGVIIIEQDLEKDKAADLYFSKTEELHSSSTKQENVTADTNASLLSEKDFAFSDAEDWGSFDVEITERKDRYIMFETYEAMLAVTKGCIKEIRETKSIQ